MKIPRDVHFCFLPVMNFTNQAARVSNSVDSVSSRSKENSIFQFYQIISASMEFICSENSSHVLEILIVLCPQTTNFKAFSSSWFLTIDESQVYVIIERVINSGQHMVRISNTKVKRNVQNSTVKIEEDSNLGYRQQQYTKTQTNVWDHEKLMRNVWKSSASKSSMLVLSPRIV